MKSPFLALCGLITLGAVHAVQDPTCVDCAAPLLANPTWGNGVLAGGNYYSPSKTGNWALGTTSGFMGQLELRGNSATGYYVWSFCPAGTAGYCRIYMNQVITIKAGVTYDFSFEYSISSVRNQANTIDMYLDTLPSRTRLFGQNTASGNTAWTTFKAGPWTATVSGDVLFTMTWRNDPNNGVFMLRKAGMDAVECRNPVSTKFCTDEPEPPAPTTTTTSQEAASTTTTTSQEAASTTTTTSQEAASTTTTTSQEAASTTSSSEEATTTTTGAATTTSAPPVKGCAKRRRRRRHH